MGSTRRMFLKRAAGGAAVVACPGLLGSCSSKPVDAGNVADLASGDLVAIVGEGVAIGLDADGLYAISTICTHANCDIAEDGTVDRSGLACACHGSTFDPNGAVTNGPAEDPLEHFAVELGEDGSITIDPSTTVAPTSRTPIA